MENAFLEVLQMAVRWPMPFDDQPALYTLQILQNEDPWWYRDPVKGGNVSASTMYRPSHAEEAS